MIVGPTFDLRAFKDGKIQADFRFQRPVRVEVGYRDTDITDVDEAHVKLYIRENDQWKDAATTCTPTSQYERNLQENELTIEICHLSQYALFGPDLSKIYLPLLDR